MFKRNPARSHVLMWMARIRNRRRQIAERLVPKEQMVKTADGVLARA